MWAEKSTENPIPMIKTIMLITSRLMFQKAMMPSTPISTETTANMTQMTQILLGMKMKMTTAMIATQTLTQSKV